MECACGTVKYLLTPRESASMTELQAAPRPGATEGREHRDRLLQGMARAVATKGYADTTIADIVREAGVSRRTFYENFADKAECLTALYESASGNALAVLRGAINPQSDWQAQVEQALSAYFGALACNPVLLRTLFIEILGLGMPGLAARQPMMAMAVVGGINEMVLQSIEQGRAGQLQELVAPAASLLRAATSTDL